MMYINNDINVNELNMGAVATYIATMVTFLVTVYWMVI